MSLEVSDTMTPMGGATGHGDQTRWTITIINMKMACLGLNKGKIEKKLNNDQANDNNIHHYHYWWVFSMEGVSLDASLA